MAKEEKKVIKQQPKEVWFEYDEAQQKIEAGEVLKQIVVIDGEKKYGF